MRRVSEKIFYYKTSGDREIDFIVRMPDQSLALFQVCETLAAPETRKRKLTALNEAMTEQQLTTGTIITRHESEQIQTAAGTVDIVPAWRFLLDA